MENMFEVPSEARMVILYVKQNSSRNNNSFIFHKEVSFYNKRIDLIQVRQDKNEKFPKIHAIEFKISNWGRCLYQAKCNRLFFPYNSIAIWKDYIHRVKQNELMELGIGLIEVDYKQSKIILEPKSSSILDKYLYSKLCKKISCSELSAIGDREVRIRNVPSFLLASK